MIEIVKYVVCDNCGWKNRIDSSKLQSESIKDNNYIEYGHLHFCSSECKKEFLKNYGKDNRKQ
jgi:hypothetical protein